jgi:hypothetical protein
MCRGRVEIPQDMFNPAAISALVPCEEPLAFVSLVFFSILVLCMSKFQQNPSSRLGRVALTE